MTYSRCRTSCIALAITGATVLTPPLAQASCLRSTDREDLKRADAAFVGRVLTVNASEGSARFRVLSVHKGHIRRGSAVRVYARPYPSSVTIDWSPKPGQRWRVYVSRNGRRWVTNDCQGTRRL